MQKLIFITLLATTFPNHILCMKRQHEMETRSMSKKKLHAEKTSPLLPIDLIGHAFTESFKYSCNAPTVIAYKIKNIRCVNKALRDYTDNPNTIRTIIINASGNIPSYRGFLANSPVLMHLPSVKNYLNQSEKLVRAIGPITQTSIRELIQNGADINYCYHFAGRTLVFPILFNIHNDYETTKLLLNSGTDQNIACIVLTPLGLAVLSKDIKLITLFLEYKPRNKHVKEAVQTDNLEILQLVLQQEDISVEEIECAKEVARKQGSDTFVQLLDEYKNNRPLSKP